MTFLKDRLVFVDVALQEFRGWRKYFIASRKKIHANGSSGNKKKSTQKGDNRTVIGKAGWIIITRVSDSAVVVHAVPPPADSIALLRDANRPSVVLRISREAYEHHI